MKSPLRIFLAGLVLGGLGVAWWFAREDAEPLPDEKKIAMERLVESQSGPRYFQVQDATPDEQGEVWIDIIAAREQVERIVRERKGDDAMKGWIYKLIDEAAEPHPSRTVGGERASLAKLNVALDASP
jgi:hypothetical protein